MRIELDSAEWTDGRGYRKNRLADAALLACPGALVQQVEIAPGDTIPDHVHHTSIEFYVVVQGCCRLVVNGDAHALNQGSMFLIRPGDVHRLHNETGERFVLLVFKTNASADDTYWRQE